MKSITENPVLKTFVYYSVFVVAAAALTHVLYLRASGLL